MGDTKAASAESSPDEAATVIVPWRGGCEHRERAWRYLKPRWEWPVIEATCPPGPWVKANAVTPAVERCPDGIVVVADADVYCDGVAEAVQAVADGAPWAVPHTLVCRLSEEATQNVLSGRQDDQCEQGPYQGILGGGIIVAHREVILSCPLDPRFVGWGRPVKKTTPGPSL